MTTWRWISVISMRREGDAGVPPGDGRFVLSDTPRATGVGAERRRARWPGVDPVTLATLASGGARNAGDMDDMPDSTRRSGTWHTARKRRALVDLPTSTATANPPQLQACGCDEVRPRAGTGPRGTSAAGASPSPSPRPRRGAVGGRHDPHRHRRRRRPRPHHRRASLRPDVRNYRFSADIDGTVTALSPPDLAQPSQPPAHPSIAHRLRPLTALRFSHLDGRAGGPLLQSLCGSLHRRAAYRILVVIGQSAPLPRIRESLPQRR